ncbi:18264_t:CDS:2 [Funneliformis geosporum]|uniref:18264_t:CDS:1 n=1 Tax=Funneliformis geosporum TaxID=1117311 RepID=A0A9W4X1D3_9GLOM|nr:18264_t:CDS:2 [Funneliformis geosporum]
MVQSLFIDTHSELHDLNRSLEDLQDEYKFNMDYNDNKTTSKDYGESILSIVDKK